MPILNKKQINNKTRTSFFKETCAIVKYRFLNRVVIVRYSSLVTALAVSITFLYLSLIFIAEKFVVRFVNVDLSFIRMLVIAFISCTIIIFYQSVRRFISAVLLSRKHELREELDELTKYLATLLKLDEVFELLISELESVLRTRCVSILIYNEDKQDYCISTSIGFEDDVKSVEINEDDELIKWMKKYRMPLVKQRLIEKLQDEKNVLFAMALLNAEVCVPMFYFDELVGVICLGERKFGKKYLPDEIDVFEDFSEQFAIIFKNAIAHYRVEMKYRTQLDSVEIFGDRHFLAKAGEEEEE